MKTNALALSALGFASVTVAQNGNDPLILNNRTGLAPVVYDTFSTSYTSPPIHKPASVTLPVLEIRQPAQEPAWQTLAVTVPVMPSPVRSNTYLSKSTTSVECWRNGYPCGQNGGQRSQRLVANFIRATPAIDSVPSQVTHRDGYMVAGARRVPPPEFFSTRPNLHLPGEAPGETGGGSMNILPIPTELIDGQHYAAPTAVPGETGEAIFGILPVPTPSSSAGSDQADLPVLPPWKWRSHAHSHSTTYSAVGPTKLPATPPEVTAPAVEAREAGVPIDWWRGPAQPIIPDSPAQPIQRHSSPSIDCERHYCPTKVHSYTDGFSTTIPDFKPTDFAPHSTKLPAVPPDVTAGVAMFGPPLRECRTSSRWPKRKVGCRYTPDAA